MRVACRSLRRVVCEEPSSSLPPTESAWGPKPSAARARETSEAIDRSCRARLPAAVAMGVVEGQAAMMRVATSSDDDHAAPDLPGIEER